MAIQIRKIKQIPFQIDPEQDELLVDNLTMDNHMDALEDLGYLKDSKETFVGSTKVYYKGRRNGVYFQYIHK